MHSDLGFIAVGFIFLCGWAARSVFGAMCLKGHLLRIERRLGIIAADSAACTGGAVIAPSPARRDAAPEIGEIWNYDETGAPESMVVHNFRNPGALDFPAPDRGVGGAATNRRGMSQ